MYSARCMAWAENKRTIVFFILFGIALFLSGLFSQVASADEKNRPNLVLIVLDDIGFNELGVFGSEIKTPTIDRLADGGMLLTEFHVAPNCSPTRAMLLSGVDSHVAGLGAMSEGIAPNQVGRPGYEGYLNFRVAALPEVLQDAGYRTYMAGKWHLGMTEETSPSSRGFDRAFSLLQAGAGSFDNMLSLFGPGKAKYREDGKLLSSLPEGFYASEYYTDKVIDYIEDGYSSGQPFFAYLAYTSAHWPLQALDETIAKYRGVYDDGYDALRVRRHNGAENAGLVPQGTPGASRMPGKRAWKALSKDEQRYESRKMEVYAAMVDDLDSNLSRLIDYLGSKQLLDNTFIFLLSDNGPEAHDISLGWDELADWIEQCCNNSFENIGKPDSYVWYGPNWGIAGNTPMRYYKGYTSQGGVRAPAIAYYPRAIAAGSRSGHLLSVKDLMPTFLELAGVSGPKSSFRGRDVAEIQGKSMLSLLRGDSLPVHDADYSLGWELFGKRALRKGKWKILYEPFDPLLEPRPPGIKTDSWQLYDLSLDPGERIDLAKTYPDILAELIGLWEEYAEANVVIIPDMLTGY